MNRIKICSGLLGILLTGGLLQAQDGLTALRKSYDFPAAVEKITNALERADSLDRLALEEELILCQNGLGMMDFCTTPSVISRYTFSIEDFFLYYPLPDKSWRPSPNQLDSTSDEAFVKATYIPEKASELYYSAKDEAGVRNIYKTSFRDTIWTVPELINENLTSSGNEIFPLVSADGQSLYFSSKGLFGMGGYDLYVSKWNDDIKDWDTPSNLGFPYSSPYDDFLFMKTPDGKYTLFASNRDCAADSVCVYVLEQEENPVHKKVDDVNYLRELASLKPKDNASNAINRSTSNTSQDNENISAYISQLNLVRDLRDSLLFYTNELDRLREMLGSETGSAVKDLKNSILTKEMALPGRKAALDAATRDLQKIEMDFLMNGIVIDPELLKEQSDRKTVGTASGYTFSRHEMGSMPDMTIEKPVPVFDYSFKILDEGQFAEDNTIPQGIIYQIQLYSLSKKATVKDLKGLSPVFERYSNQRYIYSVGLFRTYADVLKNLNTVKTHGFKSAMVIAYKDGKLVSVSDARALESTIKTIFKVRIYPNDGQSMPDIAKSVINQMVSQCDIVRLMDGGSVVFDVNPIDSREKADELVAALKAAGVANCEVQEAGTSSDTQN